MLLFLIPPFRLPAPPSFKQVELSKRATATGEQHLPFSFPFSSFSFPTFDQKMRCISARPSTAVLSRSAATSTSSSSSGSRAPPPSRALSLRVKAQSAKGKKTRECFFLSLALFSSTSWLRNAVFDFCYYSIFCSPAPPFPPSLIVMRATRRGCWERGSRKREIISDSGGKRQTNRWFASLVHFLLC